MKAGKGLEWFEWGSEIPEGSKFIAFEYRDVLIVPDYDSSFTYTRPSFTHRDYWCLYQLPVSEPKSDKIEEIIKDVDKVLDSITFNTEIKKEHLDYTKAYFGTISSVSASSEPYSSSKYSPSPGLTTPTKKEKKILAYAYWFIRNERPAALKFMKEDVGGYHDAEYYVRDYDLDIYEK